MRRPGHQSRLRARLLNGLVYLAMNSGQKVRALELATEAVEQARISGDVASLAGALRQYALAATFLARFDKAERALTEVEAMPETSANAASPCWKSRNLKPASW